MSAIDEFGDSDDEALIFAATQADKNTAQDNIEGSPRPAKKRRIECEVANTDDEDELSDTLQSSHTLHDSQDDGNQDDFEAGEEDEQGMFPPMKPRHLFHAPRINPVFDNLVVTQTQVAPPSQAWMIRGPIWKKPKITDEGRHRITQTSIQGSEESMRDLHSNEEDEAEQIRVASARKGDPRIMEA